MSADLFEAFVGSQSVKQESKESAHEQPSQLLVEADDISGSANTWQPWPAETRHTGQWHTEHASQQLWETDQDGRDVLFDAGQINPEPGLSDDVDDFGDFEEVTSKQSEMNKPQVESLPTTIDLLGLEDTTNESGKTTEFMEDQSLQLEPSNEYTQASNRSTEPVAKEQTPIAVSDSDDEWYDFETIHTSSMPADQLHGHENVPATSSINQTWPSSSLPQTKQAKRPFSAPHDARKEASRSDTLEEEPWDDFENSEGENRVASNNPANSSSTLDVMQQVLNTEPRSRPINVPPPAVLLAWLPKVFSKLATQSRRPDADLGCGIAAVQAYRASARVIAGRAARWKRDTILAQSMRIGAAGRSGGMKLATLDKGESRKEDQAAEDVIASWARYSHILNAAIARAKAQRPPMALSLKLMARIANGLDVVSAAHVCATCGLRRNERVIGIDVNVSDTFGEFWIEHWGHKDCFDTWYAFNELLDQR